MTKEKGAAVWKYRDIWDESGRERPPRPTLNATVVVPNVTKTFSFLKKPAMGSAVKGKSGTIQWDRPRQGTRLVAWARSQSGMLIEVA